MSFIIVHKIYQLTKDIYQFEGVGQRMLVVDFGIWYIPVSIHSQKNLPTSKGKI
jgi:hypothetical protein